MSELFQRPGLYIAIAAALVFPSLFTYLAIQRKVRTYRGWQHTKNNIVSYLHTIDRPISPEELANNLKMKRHRCRILLRELVQEKRVQRLDNPGGIDPILYQTPDPRIEPDIHVSAQE